MALTNNSNNNYATANFIVSATAGKGNYTTIGAALTAASSGDTIFIKPGTYTENPTLKAGVNLTAFGCDSSLNGTGNVIINGTCTLTTAGTVTISGIQLQTNSAALLAVTGSAASIVNLNNCYLNCLNNTGITYSSSSASSAITLNNCSGNLATTGIAYYTMSSIGNLGIEYCNFLNTGGSTTASSNSAGALGITYSDILFIISTSGTGRIVSFFSIFNITNQTCITTSGSGVNVIDHCYIFSGTSSAINIGTGTTVILSICEIVSSNTNAITGAGILNFSGIVFQQGQSYNVNTTTQAGGTIQGISSGNAPSAGFVGEQISSSVTSVATTSSTPKNATSINLTAGVWDISCIASALASGGTALMQAFIAGISTTTATFGTLGIDYFQINIVTAAVSGSVPVLRATLSSTTTYYLVIETVYTSTTCPVNARIVATRVG